VKPAFSTLGVPGMPIADVAELAVAAGYRGVELRGHPEEPVHPGLGAAERSAVVKEFERAGVEILAVAGYACAADLTVQDSTFHEEVDGLLRLARDLGALYVRVFPGGGDADPAEADAVAARRLGAAAEAGADVGVTILLETHDSHRTGADAERVVAAVGHPRLGVLWDVMHTWRAGEQPARTRAVLGPYLGYVQVKDIPSKDDTTPVGLGEGVLPLAACLESLPDDMWVCWEYEKRWYPQARELPEQLAPGAAYLRGLPGAGGTRHTA
jgi:sugar phosphate isomerase/epimerase